MIIPTHEVIQNVASWLHKINHHNLANELVQTYEQQLEVVEVPPDEPDSEIENEGTIEEDQIETSCVEHIQHDHSMGLVENRNEAREGTSQKPRPTRRSRRKIIKLAGSDIRLIEEKLKRLSKSLIKK